MESSKLEDLVQIKTSVLVFCLCMQDQGLTSANNPLMQVLTKLATTFLDILVVDTKNKLMEILQQEKFVGVIVQTSDEYDRCVEKFEFNFDQAGRTNIAT